MHRARAVCTGLLRPLKRQVAMRKHKVARTTRGGQIDLRRAVRVGSGKVEVKQEATAVIWCILWACARHTVRYETWFFIREGTDARAPSGTQPGGRTPSNPCDLDQLYRADT